MFQAPVERLEVSNSAALGAAVIAAAAGHDMAELQQTFCQASPGAALQPDPALATVYQEANPCGILLLQAREMRIKGAMTGSRLRDDARILTPKSALAPIRQGASSK